MIVVDTSVLVDLFRGHETDSTRALRQFEADGTPCAIPAVCCQEILQGARDVREWKLLLSYLETQERLVPVDPWRTHVEAARIFFDCRRRGMTVRGSLDCLIAQIALENNGTLLHDDEDYEKIARVRPLRTLR